MYGVGYTNLFVSTSGLISFGTADTTDLGSDLTSSPSEAVIAAFWDYLYVSGGADSKVVYQVVGSGSNEHLDIQWNDISFMDDYPTSGGLTFEVQLGVNGSIRLNFKSLETGNNGGYDDLGATATVGIKDAGTSSPAHMTLVHDRPTTNVNNRKSVLFTAIPTTSDHYSFTVGGAETDTVAVTNLATGNVNVDLTNGSGTVIASGTGGATNVAKIIGAASLAAGTYYLRVSGDANVPYSLVVTHGAAVETEPSYTPATAQSINGVQGVLGATVSAGATLTMDEVGYQPVNDLTVKGVTFGFTIGGTASTSAYYDDTGYGATAYTEDPSIIGDATGVLSFSFAQPAASVQFGIALSITTADTAGATVSLYGIGGTLIGAYPVAVASDGLEYSSGLFSYAGPTPVASVAVSFDSNQAYDFAVDNLTYTTPTDDWYSLTVPAAGSTIRLATSTPGDGSGEFVNTLAPNLQLYDSTGTTLLVSGVVGADGHNETLSYAGAAPGNYFIHLVGSSGTQGEYFLTDEVVSPPIVTAPISVSAGRRARTGPTAWAIRSPPPGTIPPAAIATRTSAA